MKIARAKFWWIVLHVFRHSKFVYDKWVDAHFVEVTRMEIKSTTTERGDMKYKHKSRSITGTTNRKAFKCSFCEKMFSSISNYEDEKGNEIKVCFKCRDKLLQKGEIAKYKTSDEPSKIQIAYWKDLEKTHENLVDKIKERIAMWENSRIAVLDEKHSLNERKLLATEDKLLLSLLGEE